jgi:hypothetical protein
VSQPAIVAPTQTMPTAPITARATTISARSTAVLSDLTVSYGRPFPATTLVEWLSADTDDRARTAISDRASMASS